MFATVRHRTVRTKGALSQDTARLMVFKLVMAAAKTWRRLKGENQLPKVIQGVTFRDGVEVTDTPAADRRLITPSPRFPHSSVDQHGGLGLRVAEAKHQGAFMPLACTQTTAPTCRPAR